MFAGQGRWLPLLRPRESHPYNRPASFIVDHPSFSVIGFLQLQRSLTIVSSLQCFDTLFYILCCCYAVSRIIPDHKFQNSGWLSFQQLTDSPSRTVCNAQHNCTSPLKVNSQKDLDTIKNCDVFVGSTTATGELEIPGIKYINGTLTNDFCKECTPKAAAITKISCSPGLSKIWRLDLAHLEQLKEIQLPKQESTDLLLLHNLPMLSAIEAEDMIHVNQLILEQLPKLKKFQVSKSYFSLSAMQNLPDMGPHLPSNGGAAIWDVALDSLDFLFNGGMGAPRVQ